MHSKPQIIKICSVVTMTWFMGNLIASFFLPFLPVIKKDIVASTTLIQYLITLFYMAKAGGMLIWGPTTEKLGRKKILLFGMALIVIGSLAGALSHNIYQLLFCRILQGLGVSATVLMGRAIINDLFDSNQAVKAFSIIMLIANVVITLLPYLGGHLAVHQSYKIAFILTTAYALVVGIISLFFVKETRQPHSTFVFSVKKIPFYYGQLFKEKNFIAYTLSVIFVVAAEAAFNTASPFILVKHFHVSPQNYGLFLTIAYSLSWIGILATGFLVKRYSLNQVFGIFAGLSLIVALFILVQAITGFSMIGFMICIGLFYVGTGIILTIYNVGVVQAHRHMIGLASSLTLFLYFTCSSLGSFVITFFSTKTVAPLSIGISILSALVFLSWLFFIKLPSYTARDSKVSS